MWPPSSKAFRQPIGDAVINSKPGLLLIVEKQLGANTLQVTRDVEAALEDLKPALAGISVDPAIFRPATFIEMSLRNLSRALLVGCALVVLVLLVFLADWRTALISSTAIPLSLLAAGLLLHYRGGTLDTMVLAGLVIALGEVVDDAIIDVENIVRRLRLNQQSDHPQSAIRVVLDASMEVRSAVLYGSLIVVVVFVPVFMLDGLAGAFFRPLALSYVLAILASLARRAHRHSGAGAPAAAETPRHPRVAARRRPEGPLSPDASGHRRAAADSARRAGGDAAPDGGGGPLSRRRVPAELPRVRLPDALGRKARHIARRDAAHHRACQPRADGRARRQELRFAHRPRRGGRRSGRAQLHRAVDQPRSGGRLRSDGGAHPIDRRRLPRPVPRSADLPARAHQGGPHRRERDGGGARVRPGAGPAAIAGAVGAVRHRGRVRRRRSHRAGTGDRPEGRRALRSRSRRRVRPDAGPGPVRRRHADSRNQGRRVLRRPAAVRRRRLGRAGCAPQPRRDPHAAGAGRQRRPGAALERRARRSDPHAQRDHPAERIAPYRRHFQRARPRSRRGGARHPGEAGRALSFRPATTPRCSASTPSARPRRRA